MNAQIGRRELMQGAGVMGALSALSTLAPGGLGLHPAAAMAAASRTRTGAATLAGATSLPWADVTAFGATGNGVTDDAAAIQAAIESLSPVAGGGIGGIVFFPVGTYIIGAPLIVTFGIQLVGASRIATVLKLKSGSGANVITTGGTFPAYSSISHLKIDGNRANNPLALDGIGTSFDMGYLYDVEVVNCTRHGIGLNGNAETHIIKCVVTGCGGNGIDLNGQSDCVIQDLWTNGNAGASINLYSCSQINMMGMQLEGYAAPHSGAGIAMNWSQAVRVAASSIAGMNNGISISNSCVNIDVSGCHFENNSFGAAGQFMSIDIAPNGNNAEQIVIANNIFTGGPSAMVRNHVAIEDPGSGAALRQCIVSGNAFKPGTFSGAAVFRSPTGTLANVLVRNNAGHVTEASGVATLPSAAVSVTVAHGLGVTPRIQDLRVTPASSLYQALRYWISNPTASSFTINVDRHPAGGNAVFAWEAAVL